jgi:hypothetical protein
VRASEDTSVEELQAEVTRLRAEVSELRQREDALRTQAAIEQRRAGQRVGALRAESEYVREQSVENRRLAIAAQQEVGRLRAELAAVQRRLSRSPYFKMRHLLGRFLGRG